METLKNRNSWVYDIETLKSCFTYSAINIDTEEIVKYVIHKDKFELLELINHLISCKGQIGFNNINFDYPIIHYILKNWKIWLAKYRENQEEIILIIYKKAQELINNQNQEGFFLLIKESEVIILQLDLFKVWHYDNRARMTSLKALEISMNYPNVMDMPIHHTEENVTVDQIEEILEYNINDVLATYEFYKKSLNKIELRKQINNKYNFNCINSSDTKIGEDLMLKLYCKATKKNPYDVKKLRTYRSELNFADCIPSYIKYNSVEFNNLLEYIKKIVVKKLKNSFEYSVIYKGFKYDLGTGGIHGASDSGIYKPKDNELIKDSDVASLYPSLAIVNGLYPQHLGKEFYTVYKEGIVDERFIAKKAGLMSISDALKLAANGIYGKSNSEYSFVYDPLYTIKTTLAGQLSLCMLGERLQDQIPNIKIIQVNTDGITSLYDKKYDELYDSICKQWELETQLVLEHAYYSKMVMRDVNNYISVTTNGKIKNKGAFEVNKVVGSEPAYHKDNSFKIIPFCIQEYYVNNTPIKETLYNHKNIYDFCGRQKFNRDSYGEIHYLKDSNVVVEKQQKNVRYYISKSNKKFVKQYLKGSTELINKGYEVEIFNKFIDKKFEDYNIDYSFYFKEIDKIIQTLEPKQMVLF